MHLTSYEHSRGNHYDAMHIPIVNVSYFIDLNILVCINRDDGGWLPKHVEENKKFHLFVYSIAYVGFIGKKYYR
jgi:hypothetical protein